MLSKPVPLCVLTFVFLYSPIPHFASAFLALFSCPHRRQFLYMRHGPADDLLTPTLPVDSQLRKYVPRRACKSSMAPSEGDPGVQPSSRGEYNLSAVPSVACRGGSYPVPVNGSEPDSRHTSKAGENLRSILDLAPPKERAAETCTLQTPPALADAVGSSMYAGSAHRSKRMIYHSYQ